MVKSNPGGVHPGNRSRVSGTSAIHGSRARSRARRLILQGLYQWQMTGATAAEIIVQLSASQNLKNTDMEYFQELLSRVIAERTELDEGIAMHLDRPLAQLDPIEHGILLLSACELKARPDVPYRVVINEAVELAKQFGAEDGHKFINAVLDRAAAKLRAADSKLSAQVS